MIDLADIHINYDANLEPRSVLCDSTVMADVDVISHFPAAVNCSRVIITVQQVKNSTTNDGNKGAKNKLDASPKPNETPQAVGTCHPDWIPIKEQVHLKQDGSLSSVTLVCPTAHQFLG